MKSVVGYLTGTVALLVVAGATVAAVVAAVTSGSSALVNIANSTLSGLGIAIGGCLGSVLILRFQAARKFIGGVVSDIQKHSKK
jgi:hypothetical protein